MKLINQSYEICNQTDFSLLGIYKHIEKCARVSYKSEDKITDISAAPFVNMLEVHKHDAPLEFGTIHFKMPITLLKTFAEDLMYHNLYNMEWIKCKAVNKYAYFTTNYRHWHVILDKVPYVGEYLDFGDENLDNYPKRYTVKLITNRAVSHEVVRHRTMSFIQESQRYCNYGKGKFNNEVTFIKPCWLAIKEGTYTEKNYHDDFYTSKNVEYDFMIHLLTAETTYFKLLEKGWKPQQARVVLPNSTKTELYMCGFKEAWEHFFELRDNKIVDPQMYDLAHPMHQDFINNKYL